MLPNKKFANEDPRFWATVKIVSETAGYSERVKKINGVMTDPSMKRYTMADILECHEKICISKGYCFDVNDVPLETANRVLEYLNYRNELIELEVKPNLMDRAQSKIEFEKMLTRFPDSKIKVQMNKQKGIKKHPSFLVNMVNFIAGNCFGFENFNNDPKNLCTVSDAEGLLKVLCRRMDGAYPTIHIPKIIWEVKEYYGTTTFGSRIADGIYETQLVGEELQQLQKEHGIKIQHVLFVDDYFTWWSCGRSYLCRLIDLLNSGHVDAIFFGREVVSEWETFIEQVK